MNLLKTPAAAVLMAAFVSNAAPAATAIGHASVTILPAVTIIETTAIELDSVGNRISTHPGIVTLTGAPNLAVAISVTANDAVSGPARHCSSPPSPTMAAARRR
jgi:hypothetical protein